VFKIQYIWYDSDVDYQIDLVKQIISLKT